MIYEKPNYMWQGMVSDQHMCHSQVHNVDNETHYHNMYWYFHWTHEILKRRTKKKSEIWVAFFLTEQDQQQLKVHDIFPGGNYSSNNAKSSKKSNLRNFHYSSVKSIRMSNRIISRLAKALVCTSSPSRRNKVIFSESISKLSIFTLRQTIRFYVQENVNSIEP